MTLSPFQLLVVLLVPTLLGVGILRCLGLRYRDDRLAFPAWAYLVGTLGTGLVLWLWSWARLPYDATWIGSLLLVAAGTLYAYALRRDRSAIDVLEEPTVPRWERWSLVAVLGLLVFVLLERFLLATQQPISIADEANIWALKAKVLFHAGGFGEAYRAHAAALGHHHHFDYPNLNPLLQLWVFVQEGTILHVENRLPIQFFGVALLLALAGALRRLVRPGLVLLILPVIANAEPTQAFNRNANADVMVALGLLVLADAWLRWRAERDERWWRLSMLALTFLLASKNEGQFYLLALAVPLALTRIRRLQLPRLSLPRRELAYGLAPLCVLVALWGSNAHFGFENELVVAKTESEALVGCASGIDEAEEQTSFLGVLATYGPARVAPVLAHHGRLLLQPEQTGFLLLFFLVLACLFPRRLFQGELFVPGVGLALMLAGYVAIYLGSPYDIAWHLDVSASRVLYQSLGFAALWLALAVHTLLPVTVPARGRLWIPERPFAPFVPFTPAPGQTTPASLPPRKKAG